MSSGREAYLAQIPDHPHRFWSKVQIAGECWEWVAGKNRKGYGVYWTEEGTRSAHSVAYQLATGHDPAGMQVHHKCKNPSCVNPAHLEAVTPKEHGKHSPKAQQTHCLNGHEFNAQNTYITKRGTRECRPCSNRRSNESRRVSF